MKEDSGLYHHTFGIDGELLQIWTEDQFNETLLAVHAFDRIERELLELQKQREELKQISRLKYYGLHLFKSYLDKKIKDVPRDELYDFGKVFNTVFSLAIKIIATTLEAAYREILQREEGTAFSLPRDLKVWELVQRKFDEHMKLADIFQRG